MTRPPDLSKIRELAELGTVLELVVDNGDGTRRVLRWSRARPRLLAPDDRTLLIVAGGTRKGPALLDDAEEAAELRGIWTGRPAVRAYRLELPTLRGRWKARGAAVRLDYRSDKWTAGRATVDYTHDHGRNVRVWEKGDPWLAGGVGVLCLKGGRLRVTARGIVG